MPDPKDPRKPLFPEEEDDLLSPEPDDDFNEPELPVVDESQEKIFTPPAERFPPVDPAAIEAELPEEPQPQRPRVLINLMTVLFSLGTIGLLVYFSLLWVDPYNALNPLPPYTPLPIIITTTPLPATVTPIPSATPIVPTEPATPTSEQALVPTIAPTFTPSAFPFTLWEFGVDYIGNQKDGGCAWSSIAGNVVDLDGVGIADFGVRIVAQEGTLNTTVTTGEETFFGSGGFEFKLADEPALAPYIVQLLDPDGNPVSEEYLVVTSDDCVQNVVVLNFVQNRAL